MLQVAMENFQHNTGIHCFDFIFWFVCIWEKFTNMNLLTNEATLSTTVNKVSPGKLCAFFLACTSDLSSRLFAGTDRSSGRFGLPLARCV